MIRTNAENLISSAVPVGGMMPFAGTDAPAGYLWCRGQAVSRSTYAKLFSIIGTAYGAGDGSTTFNLPDTLDRALIGKGNSSSVGTKVGSNTGSFTLTTANLPAHSHTVIVGYRGKLRRIDDPRAYEDEQASQGVNSFNQKMTRLNVRYPLFKDRGDVDANYESGLTNNWQKYSTYNNIKADMNSSIEEVSRTTSNTGSGSAVTFDNRQASLVVNYIIRYI